MLTGLLMVQEPNLIAPTPKTRDRQGLPPDFQQKLCGSATMEGYDVQNDK
jgi:hypothetical protein